MAELTPEERLQPSLLDRLTDDEPEKTQEPRELRVLSLRKLREGVLRDLGWLLNAGNLAGTVDLSEAPEAAQSVVNYGLPDLSGKCASGVEIADVERIFRQAILDFEPRILRKSLKVKALVTKDEMTHNALQIQIEGELWAQPIPERLFLRTEIDLETGNVSLADIAGRSTG